MNKPTLLPLLLVLVMAAGGARAATITGQVQNSTGAGVSGVTVNVNTGATTVSVLTDLNGFFTLVVPSGTYDVIFLPPGSSLVPKRIQNVTVVLSLNLGVVTLQDGFPLSGFVLTPLGLPVANADTNVYDQATGQKLWTPDDNTDATGFFEVVIPAGTYRWRVAPPQSLLLVAHQIRNIVVNAPTSLGNITLQPGVLVTGTVRDSQTFLPLADVDLDADDAFTGERIVTPGDNTDASGNFSLVLPTGLFHLSFDPPVGDNHAGRRVYNVTVAGPGNLGTFGLDVGATLSGTLVGPGGVPVAGADLDALIAPGNTGIYISHDKTDANGAFSVVVPFGSYQLTFEPDAALGLVGFRTATINANTSQSLGTISLQTGVILSGTIIGWDGLPEAEADLDIIDPVTGAELITPGDLTDANGAYSAVVPQGTWNVRIQTRKLSFSRATTIQNVVVNGPTTLNQNLPIVPIVAYMSTTGVPTVGQGGPLVVTVGFLNFTINVQPTNVSVVMITPGGNEVLVIPPIPLNVPPQTPFLLPNIPIPLPPVNPAFLGQPFRLELRFTEQATGIEQDSDRLTFIIL